MHDLSFALLRGLDQQYNAFYASTSHLLHTLTFDDIVANLITFDSHLARQNNDHITGEFPPSAHFTQTNNQDQRNNRGGRNNRGRGRGQRTVPRCQLCFKQGHRVINCYERFNKDFLQPNYKEVVLGQQSRNIQPQANLTNTGSYKGNLNPGILIVDQPTMSQMIPTISKIQSSTPDLINSMSVMDKVCISHLLVHHHFIQTLLILS